MVYIDKLFRENFFDVSIEKAVTDHQQFFNDYFNTEYDLSHFRELHEHGKLPITIMALPEGKMVPIGVPVMVVYNTEPQFFWVTNFIESLLSNLLWGPMTAATIANAYRFIMEKHNTENMDPAYIDWQGHDFSMRGMLGLDATMLAGMGWFPSFNGTDNVPAIHAATQFYGPIVAGTVPATEHSVMSAGSKEGELETFQRLFKTYPKGILSVVSDTWDLWNVLTNILPQLKDEIMSREGKLVIRPDSGNPADIICGRLYPTSEDSLNNEIGELLVNGVYYKDNGHTNNHRWIPQHIVDDNPKPSDKGVIELLWDTFGGYEVDGLKVLDEHIGAIYGEAITLEMCDQILTRLVAKGFHPCNIVMGVGSYALQYNTRDTYGFAMKATYTERLIIRESGNAQTVGFDIFKDPVTASGGGKTSGKKSARGLLKVIETEDGYVLREGVTWAQVRHSSNAMKPVYDNGAIVEIVSMNKVRETLAAEREKLRVGTQSEEASLVD